MFGRKAKIIPKKETFLVRVVYDKRDGNMGPFTLERAKEIAEGLYDEWIRYWHKYSLGASRPQVEIYELVETVDRKVKGVDQC